MRLILIAAMLGALTLTSCASLFEDEDDDYGQPGWLRDIERHRNKGEGLAAPPPAPIQHPSHTTGRRRGP